MANNEALARLIVTIGANTADFAKAMQQTSTGLKTFSSQITGFASTLGVAFGTREVVGFGLEVSKLAGEAEGVTGAFMRLPNALKVMDDLKQATGNTVSELNLMKAAVQASNFQIPIENLASLFKFATLRAQQTGQSVDYLVQSIILGIGRKSPLILDNLGISAVRLREKLKGVSAEAATVGDVAKVVGDIASEELQNMAGFSDNAATKMQRLSASWDNLKVSMGKAVNSGGVLADVFDALTTIVDQFNKGAADKFLVLQSQLAQSIKAESAPAVEKLVGELLALRNEFGLLADNTKVLNMARAFKLSDEQAARFFNTMQKINGEVKAAPLVFQDPAQLNTLDSLQEKLKQLNEQFEQLDVTNKEALATKGKEIIALDTQIRKLNELRKASADQATGLAAVRLKLSEVTKELESANLSDSKRLNTLRQEKQALEELIASQDRLNKKKNESLLIDTSAAKLPSLFKFEQSDVDKMVAAISRVKNAWVDYSNKYIEVSGLVTSGIADMAAAFGKASVNSKDFGNDVLQAVGSFAQQFGSILIANGVAALAFKSFNPTLMIAAGAALVALGAAVSATVASRPSLGSSSAGSSAISSNDRAQSGVNGGLMSIIADGEWRIDGRDLVFIYDKNKGLDASRRG